MMFVITLNETDILIGQVYWKGNFKRRVIIKTDRRLTSNTWLQGLLSGNDSFLKAKKWKKMLICGKDRPVKDKNPNAMAAKFFWIYKFKGSTKMLKCNIFRFKTRQKVRMAFERCPFEISTNFYFLVELYKKVWTWSSEVASVPFW